MIPNTRQLSSNNSGTLEPLKARAAECLVLMAIAVVLSDLVVFLSRHLVEELVSLHIPCHVILVIYLLHVYLQELVLQQIQSGGCCFNSTAQARILCSVRSSSLILCRSWWSASGFWFFTWGGCLCSEVIKLIQHIIWTGIPFLSRPKLKQTSGLQCCGIWGACLLKNYIWDLS